MEQCDSVSFSSVVAGLLLCKRNLTSKEVVNFLSKLNCEGIDLDDDNENIDDLYLCVDVDMNCEFLFRLRDSLSYDTVLCAGITVRDFLEINTDKKILDVIQKDSFYGQLYQMCFQESFEKETIISDNLSFHKNKFFPIIGDKKNRNRKIKGRKSRASWYSFLGGSSLK